MTRVRMWLLVLVFGFGASLRAWSGDGALGEMARILVDYQSYMRGDLDASARFYLARAMDYGAAPESAPLAELALRLVLAIDAADFAAVDLGESEARRILAPDFSATPEIRDLARRLVARALAFSGRRDEAMAMHRQRGLAMAWSVAGPIADLDVFQATNRAALVAATDAKRVEDVILAVPDAEVFDHWRKNPPWLRVPEGRAFPYVNPWAWTDAARGGAVTMRVGLSLEHSDSQAVFHLYSDVSWRLFIDGNLVAAVDRNNAETPREQYVAVPLGAGDHEIFLLLPPPPAGADLAALRFALRFESASPFSWGEAVSHDGSVAITRREATHPDFLTELARHAAADASLRAAYAIACAEQDMFDEACWQIASACAAAPDNLNTKVFAGLLYARNPLLAPERRNDVAAAWHRKALAVMPDVVPSLLFLADLAASADRPEEAERLLDQAHVANPASLGVLRARGEWARRFASAARTAEAWRELDAAFPSSLAAQRAIASMPDRENMDMERRLEACRNAVAAGDNRPDSLMRLADALADSGGAQEAAAAIRRALAGFPGDVGLLAWAGQRYSRLGLYDEAAGALAEAIRLMPRRADLWRVLGDVVHEQGREETALGYWRASLAADPGQHELREMADSLSGVHEPLEYDGGFRAAAMMAEAAADRYHGDVVRLLDRSVVVMERDGSFRRLTHEIDLARTRRGGELLADVSAPGELLTARTVFANGESLESESVPGRSGLRLPALHPGAAREIQYLEFFPAKGSRPPRQAPWFFQHPGGNMPYLLSEYEIWAPKGFPLVHVLRDYGLGVEFERTEHERYDHYRWTARLGQSSREPDSVHVSERLASVEIGVRTGWDDVVFHELSGLSGRLTPSREMLTILGSLFRMQGGGRLGPEDSARAVYRFVCDNVDPAPILSSEKAAHTLANRQGDRNLLLLAMLRAAGFNAHPAAARPSQDFYQPAVWELPRRDLFPVPLVRLSLPGGPPVWLDTRFETLAFGKLPDDLSGATVITFLADGAAFDTLPRLPDSETGRIDELRLLLPRDGEDLAAVGRSTVKGVAGLRRHELMANAGVGERRLATLALLYPVFPDAVLLRTDAARPAGDDSYAHERYEIRSATTVEKRPDGAFAVPLCLSPLDVVSGESRNMRTRETACHVRLDTVREDRNTFVLPEGGRFVSLPRSADLPGVFGLYQLRVSRRAPGQVEVVRRLRFPAQRVKPWEWKNFLRYLDDIDLAERQWIEYVVE